MNSTPSEGASGANVATVATEKSKYTNRFAIYKARKAGGGAALRFDFNPSREAIFAEFAPQRAGAEREFDWENKMVFKLGVSDIGKIMAFFEGKTGAALDLYHDPTKSLANAAGAGAANASGIKNASLAVAKTERGFAFKLSQQDATGSLHSVSVNVGEDEAALLRVLLRRAIERIYNW